MTTPVWKLLPVTEMRPVQVVWRRWDDGKEESCLVTDQAYLKWVAEGNQPEPAEETQ